MGGKGTLISFWYFFFFYISVNLTSVPKSVSHSPMVKNSRQFVWVRSIFQIHSACLSLNSPRKCPNDLITTQAFLSRLCRRMTRFSKIYIIEKEQDSGGGLLFFCWVLLVGQQAGLCQLFMFLSLNHNFQGRPCSEVDHQRVVGLKRSARDMHCGRFGQTTSSLHVQYFTSSVSVNLQRALKALLICDIDWHLY